MTDKLRAMFEYHRAARHYPGAHARVECDGAVLVDQVFGTMQGESPGDPPGPAMRPDAIFRLASLSKPIVSFLAMMLVDEQLLELDAPVSRYLPVLAKLRLADGGAPKRAPSIRDLFRHTAGLPYLGEIRDAGAIERVRATGIAGRSAMTADAFLAALAQVPLAHEPGTAFRYGYATDVLGLVIESILGERLGTALETRLFRPLGMHETGFSVSAAQRDRMPGGFAEDRGWHGYFQQFAQIDEQADLMQSGGGGLASTITDYARFARMLAHGGVHEGQRLLTAASFAEMTTDQLGPDIDGPYGFTGSGFGFGLGVAVRQAWGLAAYPCAVGEFTWSGVTGTLLFVDPARHWFALMFSCNNASRMMTRFEFRRTIAAL